MGLRIKNFFLFPWRFTRWFFIVWIKRHGRGIMTFIENLLQVGAAACINVLAFMLHEYVGFVVLAATLLFASRVVASFKQELEY